MRLLSSLLFFALGLSIGSVIAFTSVFLAVTISAGLNPFVALPLLLVVTAAFGAVSSSSRYARRCSSVGSTPASSRRAGSGAWC